MLKYIALCFYNASNIDYKLGNVFSYIDGPCAHDCIFLCATRCEYIKKALCWNTVIYS